MTVADIARQRLVAAVAGLPPTAGVTVMVGDVRAVLDHTADPARSACAPEALTTLSEPHP